MEWLIGGIVGAVVAAVVVLDDARQGIERSRRAG